jgi:hypothetical protein
MKSRFTLCGILIILALGVVAYKTLAESPVWLSTSSPKKTFTVELTGKKSRPSAPGIEHEARFNLLKNGEYVVRDAYVDSYDWFDSDFGEMYPEHTWMTESILRFGLNVSESGKSLDSLTVSNRTDKSIRYLKITAADMLFVFDLPPHSITRLPVPHQGWLSWVAGEGEFGDGRSIPFIGVNFFHRDKLKEPLRYCLSVEEIALRIESSVMDGYNGDAPAERPNVPIAIKCEE